MITDSDKKELYKAAMVLQKSRNKEFNSGTVLMLKELLNAAKNRHVPACKEILEMLLEREDFKQFMESTHEWKQS